jgi:opacity protein-like surface antigen
MMIKHIIVSVFVLLLSHNIGFTQEEEETEYMFQSIEDDDETDRLFFIEVGGTYTTPKGIFSRRLGKDELFGFELGCLGQIKKDKPLFIGLHYSNNSYGRANATLTEELEFTLVDFDYRTSAQIHNIHSIVRFYPAIGFWRIDPYVEAWAGTKWFLTSTTKSLVDDAESSDTNFSESDAALSYGGAIGLNCKLANSIYLNLRASYLPGLQASYLVYRANTIKTSTLDAFDLVRSGTDIILYSVGLTISLGD